MYSNPKKFEITGSTLKCIAMIAMLLDHIGASLLAPQLAANPNINILYYVLRLCGRIAFPIFCFLLVEGFFHTKNFPRYCLRLAAFAILSEIPFDLAFHQTLFYPEAQNVFFTLFIGLLTIYGIQYVKIKFAYHNLAYQISSSIILLFGLVLAWLLKTDYSYTGILVITALFICYPNRLLASCISCFFLCLMGTVEITSLLSVPLIKSYNGKRGLSLKYVFYLFYPAHLLLLYLVGR